MSVSKVFMIFPDKRRYLVGFCETGKLQEFVEKNYVEQIVSHYEVRGQNIQTTNFLHKTQRCEVRMITDPITVNETCFYKAI